MNYRVTFKFYDSDVYCTNICTADNEEKVKAYYNERHKVLAVSPAKEYELEEARRKGMPFITLV